MGDKKNFKVEKVQAIFFREVEVSRSEAEAKISGYPLAPKMQLDFDQNIFVKGIECLFNSRKVSEHGNLLKEQQTKGEIK
jgi:hypothetical protein